MTACALCGGSPRESTLLLDSTTKKLEECEITITRLENQGVIKFVAGILFGAFLGAAVVAVSWSQKGSIDDTKDVLQQAPTSRAN